MKIIGTLFSYFEAMNRGKRVTKRGVKMRAKASCWILLLFLFGTIGVVSVHAGVHYYGGYYEQDCPLFLCYTPNTNGVGASISAHNASQLISTQTVAAWVSLGFGNLEDWAQTGLVWGLTPDGQWRLNPILYTEYNFGTTYIFSPLSQISWDEAHVFQVYTQSVCSDTTCSHIISNNVMAKIDGSLVMNQTMPGSVDGKGTIWGIGQAETEVVDQQSSLYRLPDVYTHFIGVQGYNCGDQCSGAGAYWYGWSASAEHSTYPYITNKVSSSEFYAESYFASGGGTNGPHPNKPVLLPGGLPSTGFGSITPEAEFWYTTTPLIVGVSLVILLLYQRIKKKVLRKSAASKAAAQAE